MHCGYPKWGHLYFGVLLLQPERPPNCFLRAGIESHALVARHICASTTTRLSQYLEPNSNWDAKTHGHAFHNRHANRRKSCFLNIKPFCLMSVQARMIDSTVRTCKAIAVPRVMPSKMRARGSQRRSKLLLDPYHGTKLLKHHASEFLSAVGP